MISGVLIILKKYRNKINTIFKSINDNFPILYAIEEAGVAES